MKQSFYLAYCYLTYHKIRTSVLIIAIGIVVFLPNGLQKLIEESESKMMSRAETTPLIIGAKGSSTDLVINTLYFQQEKIENISIKIRDQLDQTDFGYSIPIFSAFQARGFPIIGTSLDYLSFRKLDIEEGRIFGFLGECVLGSKVAENLNLAVGDSIISSPENLFDLAGVYPLKMRIVGLLGESDTPDDMGIFTDVKTSWVIMGLGHGHQNLVEVRDQSVILSKNDSVVTANAKLYMYNEINGKNMDSFHFHGNITDFPLTSLIYVPSDQKSSTILRGKFETGELDHQIIVPIKVIEKLLESIFRIKKIFDTMFVVVSLSTLMILGLIIILSLRLRKDELYTMFTIGSSKSKVTEIVLLELFLIIGSSIMVALIFNFVTGLFVNEFINYFIL